MLPNWMSRNFCEKSNSCETTTTYRKREIEHARHNDYKQDDQSNSRSEEVPMNVNKPDEGNGPEKKTPKRCYQSSSADYKIGKH